MVKYNEKTKIGMIALILLANGLLFYLLNAGTEWLMDDFVYFFTYNRHQVTDGIGRVKDIYDILHGMVNHYYFCNGRIPPHFLLQFFLMYDKVWFNIANSVFFALLGYLIYKHCTYGRKRKPLFLLCVFLIIWFFNKFISIVFLWPSASVNYLWTTVSILIYFLPFRAYWEQEVPETKGTTVLLYITAVIFGLLAGWSNENMGGAVILMSVLFLVFYKIEKRKIPVWAILGSVFSAIGYGILMIAPANRYRMDHTHKIKNFYERFPKFLPEGFKNIAAGLVAAAVLVLITVIVYKTMKLRKKRSDVLLPLIYFLGGLASACAMMFSPEYPHRAFTGSLVLMFISAGILASQLFRDTNFIKNKAAVSLLAVLIAAAAVVFGCMYVNNYKGMLVDKQTYADALTSVETQKMQGKKDIVIVHRPPVRRMYSPYVLTRNLINNDGCSEWENSWMARYFNVHSIKTYSYDKYEKIKLKNSGK